MSQPTIIFERRKSQRRKILALLVAPVLMLVLVAPVVAQASLPLTTDLIADGRDTALDVGDLTVAGDGSVSFVTHEGSTDWRLEETHLYVGDDPRQKARQAACP